jgi:DNA-binding transcriptional LysR family regulator
MQKPDLNLLFTLDVLLAEGSVARAARRLGLSASAMSRSLARLRRTTADPLLVRAGRGLVPSPRAEELRERVRQVVHDAEAALRPARPLDPARLARTFTLRTSDGFVENFGPALVARVANEAPRVRLRFVTRVDRDSGPLREGTVDLETGVVSKGMGPELRAQALLRDRFVGAMRKGHPLARGKMTLARYAAAKHVAVTREGSEKGPVDIALAPLGLQRNTVAMVTGFSAALALARGSDLLATVPERHTGHLRDGMLTFALPMAALRITVSLLWHPRMDADPGHRWLRQHVREVCA